MIVEASLFYTCGAYRHGAEVYEVILSLLDRDADVVTYATAQHNGAYCYLELGEIGRAEKLFVESLATWDALGLDSQRARAAWGLASIAVARGDLQSGLQALDSVRRQLTALGLMNDEALVRLDMADVLLALDRSTEAQELLEGIAVQFASEGMMRNARIALAHLTDALRRNRQPAHDLRREVRHVRDYLAKLPVFSSLPFAPPA